MYCIVNYAVTSKLLTTINTDYIYNIIMCVCVLL